MLIKPGFSKRHSIPVLCDGTPVQGQGLCVGPLSSTWAGVSEVAACGVPGSASTGIVPQALQWAQGRALPAAAVEHSLGSCSLIVGWQPRWDRCRVRGAQRCRGTGCSSSGV